MYFFLCYITNFDGLKTRREDAVRRVEEWKPIHAKWNASKFEVSNLGNLRKGNRLYSGGATARFQFVNDEKKSVRPSALFLVAECFVPNPHGYAYVRLLNKDEPPHATNLQWVRNRNCAPPEEYQDIPMWKRAQIRGLFRGVTFDSYYKRYVCRICRERKEERKTFYISSHSSESETRDAAIKTEKGRTKRSLRKCAS